jgi:hypothetical protein
VLQKPSPVDRPCRRAGGGGCRNGRCASFLHAIVLSRLASRRAPDSAACRAAGAGCCKGAPRTRRPAARAGSRLEHIGAPATTRAGAQARPAVSGGGPLSGGGLAAGEPTDTPESPRPVTLLPRE